MSLFLKFEIVTRMTAVLETILKPFENIDKYGYIYISVGGTQVATYVRCSMALNLRGTYLSHPFQCCVIYPYICIFANFYCWSAKRQPGKLNMPFRAIDT
jgi:hypothetical protein